MSQPPETIDAGPVTLRRWRPEWAAATQAAVEASLPELRPFMPWATDDHDLAASAEYIARSNREWDAGETFNYAILLDDTVIGSTGLMTRMGPGVLEIGYWVHSAHAGKGIASAVADTLAAVGLALPGIERVAIKHDPANPASGRVAEKAGFTRAGETPAEVRAPGQTGVEWIWERRAAPHDVP